MSKRGAWLTPDIGQLSNPLTCRKISISGDLWLYVSGALELLADSDNWEQFGSATPDDMANYFTDAIDAYLNDNGC